MQYINPTFETVGKYLELNFRHKDIDFKMSCKLQGSLNFVMSIIHYSKGDGECLSFIVNFPYFILNRRVRCRR